VADTEDHHRNSLAERARAARAALAGRDQADALFRLGEELRTLRT